MTIPMYIATTAWLSLVAGLLSRKNRKLHVKLMLTGISLDVALVLFLQITREAVQTALKFELSALQHTHIAFSTAALLLYPLVIFLGWGLYNSPQNSALRQRHRAIAILCFILRTLGFLFMFSMLGRDTARQIIPSM